MGLSCFKPDLPPEVEEILNTVEEKVPEITKTFLVKELKLKKDLEDLLKERHTKVEKDINDKVSEDKLKKTLLDYNKKEIENEKEIICNETDKLHTIYDLGLELSDKLKKITLDKLKEKLNKAPELAKAAIRAQINEVEKYSAKEFLNSSFGKPLKTALEKHGLREKYLKEYMDKLKEERLNRRKLERKEFNLKENQFPPEDELQFTAKDLFESIFDEYKGDFIDNIKSKIINKKNGTFMF